LKFSYSEVRNEYLEQGKGNISRRGTHQGTAVYEAKRKGEASYGSIEEAGRAGIFGPLKMAGGTLRGTRP